MTADAEPAGIPDRRRHLVAVALLLLLFGLLLGSERGRSPTADEPNHLVRGVAYWAAPDVRLSSAHPPLANAFAGIPAALGDREPDFERFEGWETARQVRVSRAYVRQDYGQARRELRWGRLMIMLLSVGFGAYLYGWTDRRWGWPTAPFALALYVLHPTLLAHGRLMTTDLAIVAAGFVACTAALAYAEARGFWRWVGLAAAVCFMVGVKHSGGPLFVLLSAIVMVWAAAGWGRFEAHPLPRRLAEAAGSLFAVGLVVLLFVNGLYRFEETGLTVQQLLDHPEPSSWVARRWEGGVISEQGPLGRLPRGLPIPLPYTYVAGLFTVRAQNAMGHGEFFFGLRDQPGHPLYFPTLLVLKSPVGLLTLLGAALGLVVARRRLPSATTGFMLALCALFLVAVMRSRINIGVRHAMLLLPFAAVFAARGAALLWTEGAGPDRLRRVLVGLALGACALAVAWPFPRYLGYFNGLAGGPGGGLKVSVIAEDWGQDLEDAAAVLRDLRPDTPVHYYSMFGLRFDELRHHGLEVRRLKCSQELPAGSLVLLHLTDIVRKEHKCFPWREDLEPLTVVGHHLHVYEVPPRG